MQICSEIANDEDWDDEEDYDLLHRCEMLIFTVEIGELHERDKFTWSELTSVTKKKNSCYGLRKKELEFEFKMNHIKQVIRLEIAGQFSPISLSRVSGTTL